MGNQFHHGRSALPQDRFLPQKSQQYFQRQRAEPGAVLCQNDEWWPELTRDQVVVPDLKSTRPSGARRSRIPVASKIALASAAAAGRLAPSPAPVIGRPGESISATSTLGASSISRIG